MLHRITSIYIALLLTVYLLALPQDGFAAVSLFKYNLFIFICGGYVLVVSGLRIMYAVTGTPVGDSCTFADILNNIKHTQVAVKFMLMFLFFTILSALFSAYPGTFRGMFRQEGVLTIGIYVLSCVYVMNYARPGKWMLFLLGAAVVPFCLLAFIQLTGANPFMLYPSGYNYYGADIYYTGKFLSTIGNTGLVAAFVSLATGVLAMAVIKLDFAEKWFLSLPLMLLVVLIFVMGVDAALVALVAGFALMLPVAVTNQKTLASYLIVLAMISAAVGISRVLVFYNGGVNFMPVRIIYVIAVCFSSLLALLVIKLNIFSKIPARWYRVFSAIVLIGGIILTLSYLWLYSGEPHGMIYEASQILRGRWEDSFGSHRVYIWRNIFERIRLGTLLLGTGPDTLGHWDIPNFHRLAKDGRVFITSIDAAHNELLHILATGGLLSLLAYLGAIITAFIYWLRNPQNKPAAIAGAGVLFYVIQAQFGISQFHTAPFFWACFGIMMVTFVGDAPNTRNLRCKKMDS